MRFKALADKKKQIYDEDIEALVDEEIAHRARPHQGAVADRDRRHHGAAVGHAHARHRGRARHHAVDRQRPGRCDLQGDPRAGAARGDARALPGARGDRRHRRAGGSLGAAVGAGRSFTAKGADPDTLVASAKAYLGALNKLISKRSKTASVERPNPFHRRRVIRPKNRQAGNFRPDAKSHAKRPGIKVKSRSSSPSGHEIRNSFHGTQKITFCPHFTRFRDGFERYLR